MGIREKDSHYYNDDGRDITSQVLSRERMALRRKELLEVASRLICRPGMVYGNMAALISDARKLIAAVDKEMETK